MEASERSEEFKLEGKPRTFVESIRNFLDRFRHIPDLNTGFEKRPNQSERARMNFDPRGSVLREADKVSRNAQANAAVDRQKKGG